MPIHVPPPLARLALLLAPAALIAAPSVPHAPSVPPAPPAPAVLVLDVPGHVVIRRGADSTIEVDAQATVRGFTLGTTNARQRAPYATERLVFGDTVLIRPVPRPELRAVGISWQQERFHHVVSVPADLTLLIRGAARAQVDGQAAPRCRSNQWVGTVAHGLRCVDAMVR